MNSPEVMNFNWQIRTLKEWRDLYAKSTQQNWMQTWAYAQASLATDHLRSRLGLIEKDGQQLGVLCVQEIKLGPIHIVNLRRGPLWFAQPSTELFIEFASAFRKEFPRSFFQRLRWLAEYDIQDENKENLFKQLNKIGFKLRKENFVTSWIDLTQSIEQLRKNTEQKWRNCLNKAEKSNLTIQHETRLQNKNLFFAHYKEHQRSKNYHGPSEKFLRIEFSELEKTNDIFYLWAFHERTPIACMVFTVHGNTVAYRMGWNTESGRTYNAHYLLLWQALLISKERNLKYFDIGGLLPEDSPGITKFKNGLGGQISNYAILSNF